MATDVTHTPATGAVPVYLPADTERTLREKAAAAGLPLDTYLIRLAEKDAPPGTLAKPSLAELLAPIRKAFEGSGMTDRDLADLVEEAREEIYQEQQARKRS